MPASATDCHAHVFGPAARYPYQDNRSYTPPDAALRKRILVDNPAKFYSFG